MKDVYMISYLRSGHCWWVLRCYTDETFDLWFTNDQPKLDDGIPRTRYDIDDLDRVVLMGELRDWIAGVVGQLPSVTAKFIKTSSGYES